VPAAAPGAGASHGRRPALGAPARAGRPDPDFDRF
jgi:hypothetical protein